MMSERALRDWDRRDREQTKALSRYPRCCYCGHHIQTDSIYEIDENKYACEDCIQDRGQHLDDFMSDREMDGGLFDGLF